MSKKKSLGKINTACRGFETLEFKDYYGTECSLQQSSLALVEVLGWSAVWLGVNEPELKIRANDARLFGIKTDQTTGWIDYPIPPEVSKFSRIHLERRQVELLVKHLQAWLKNNSFELKK